MLRVRMLQLAAGPEGALEPGSVVDVGETLAAVLIAVGAAVAVDPPVTAAPPPADAPTPVTASAKSPTPKGKG